MQLNLPARGGSDDDVYRVTTRWPGTDDALNLSNPLPLAPRTSMRARWSRVLIQDRHRTSGVDMSLRAHIFLSLLCRRRPDIERIHRRACRQ